MPGEAERARRRKIFLMEKKKTYYITTPIYYTSGTLHIGHGYTTVAADAVARFRRMQGYDVMFLTGSDEHGQKIEDKAAAVGKTPKAYVDEIVAQIKSLWKLLDISYDRFIRTTDPAHEKAVQKIFRRLHDQGDIYKGAYKGWYCKPCESFWTETQLKDGKCPDCGREVKWTEEEAYFFRLSKYADRLVAYYKENPQFISPPSRMNEMINNFIKPGLEDLCVSRTSFTWGIPVDFDPKHVIYVWIDALSNYITALGYGSDDDSDYRRYWPADVHLMAKEIVRFHSIIWPAILMALDLPLPKRVFGHGWLLLGGDKMSKSKGNVVDPVLLCGRYSVDAVRYFLLREVPFGADSTFSTQALLGRVNADLANDLGNLVSRTVAMVQQNFDGTLPESGEEAAPDGELRELAAKTKNAVEADLDGFQFSKALEDIWAFIARTNKYIDETAPWVLAKDAAKKPRLARVLRNLCESVRLISVFIAPFMPATSKEIRRRLGLKDEVPAWSEAAAFDALPAGFAVQKGKPLFPRLDIPKELDELSKLAPQTAVPEKTEKAEKAAGPEGFARIGIDAFGKVALRVAAVEAAEKIKKSRKLLKLSLDVGGEKRQVVSGIASWYAPEDLVGKKVILVANLEPAKLCGVESQGMILAADDGDAARVLFVDASVPSGAKIR